MKKCFLLLGLSAMNATLQAADSPLAPAVDRVGFPRGYATNFAVLRAVSKDGGAKLVTVYGNAQAASVTNKSQLPYPNGSVLVMETASARKDAAGQPVKDAQGTGQKDQVLGLHVMRRGPDFGQAYGVKRSGQWEFVEYRADGSYITPPEKSASCAECHIKAGQSKDYVYKGRFPE